MRGKERARSKVRVEGQIIAQRTLRRQLAVRVWSATTTKVKTRATEKLQKLRAQTYESARKFTPLQKTAMRTVRSLHSESGND